MTTEKLLNLLLSFNDNVSFVFDRNINLIFKNENTPNLKTLELENLVKRYISEGFAQIEFEDYLIKFSKVQIEDELIYYLTIISCCNFLYENLKGIELVKSVVEKIPGGIGIVHDKKVIFRNKTMLKLMNLDKSDMLKEPEKVVSGKTLRIIKQIMSGKNDERYELLFENLKGKSKWTLIENGFFNIGNDAYTILFATDITKQKNIELEFKESKEQLGYAFESLNEAVIIIDTKGLITLFNNKASALTGYSKEQALGNLVTNLLVVIDETDSLVDYISIENCDNRNYILKSNNELFRQVVFKKSRVLDNSENNLGSVITISDISSIKRKEKEITYLSYHDVLTGLHNRTFFEEQIKILDTERQYPLAIIMGDVNGLKLTNDVFGHDAGDQLLKSFAKVLKNTCRHEDVIARWGGDEFIILLPQTDDKQAYIVMNRIISGISKLYKSGNVTSIIPSLSLGYGVKTNKLENVYDALKTAENNMYKRKMLTSSSVYSSIIESMKKSLYEKSNETEEHAERLFSRCKMIAKQYKVSADEMNELELFAVLHDIGKIGIKDEVLNKAGRLNDEEWEIMKTHPEIGYRIAQASKELKGVGEYILTHHEHFDGNGYPRALKGYDIPLLSRILSVVDAYDAITNDRPYSKARSKEEAFAELIRCSGTQFDPDVVKVFIGLFK